MLPCARNAYGLNPLELNDIGAIERFYPNPAHEFTISPKRLSRTQNRVLVDSTHVTICMITNAPLTPTSTMEASDDWTHLPYSRQELHSPERSRISLVTQIIWCRVARVDPMHRLTRNSDFVTCRSPWRASINDMRQLLMISCAMYLNWCRNN